MTTLYKRQGRRYVAWGHAEHYNQDLLRAGQWRLSYCPRDGHTRYAYDVRPDTAGFVAAAELARDRTNTKRINDLESVPPIFRGISHFPLTNTPPTSAT